MKNIITDFHMTTTSKEDDPQSCWEFLECPKEIRDQCEIFRKSLGFICWLVIEDTTTGCHGYDKFDGCINCPWFKKKNHNLSLSDLLVK